MSECPAHAADQGDVLPCTPVGSGSAPVRIGGLQAARLLLAFQRSRLGALEMLAQYRRDVVVSVPRRRFIFAFESSTAEYVFGAGFRDFDRGLGLRNLRALTGDNLLTSDGDTWAASRRDHAARIRNMPLENIQPQVAAFLDRCVGLHGESAIEVRPLCSRLAFQLLVSSLIGPATARSHGSVLFEAERASTLVSALMTLPMAISTPLTRWIARCLSVQPGLSTFDAVASEVSGFREGEPLGLLFAGVETLSAVLSWSLVHLAEAPDWQDRLRMADGGEQVGKHFTMEVIRLHPPVWMATRRVRTEVQLGTLTLHEGDEVLLPVWSYNRNPNVWAHPRKFDPRRFAEDKAGFGRLESFGAGPHICPARKPALSLVSLALQEILRSCSLSPAYPRGAAREANPGLTLFPARRLRVNFLPLGKDAA